MNIEYAESYEDSLKRRVKKLESALRFYADSYTYGDGNGMSWDHCEISKDRGAKAREALNE